MTNATVNLLGNYDLSSNNLNNVVIQNGMAYLPAGEQGLFLVDVKNPSSPKLVKQLDSLGYVYDVTVSGKTAFVVSETDGLKIVDVTNPAQSNVLSTFTDSIGNVQQVVVVGNTAYLADWEKGLLIVDVSNLNAPQLSAAFSISHAKSIVLARNNTLALIVSDSAELVIVDIKNATSPKKLGSIKLGNDVREISVLDDNVVAVASGEDGLKLVNISDTTAPKLVGSLPLNLANAVTTIDKQHIALANDAKGLVVVDVSNLAAPKITESFPNTRGESTEITLDGSTIYLVNNSADKQNLQILSLPSSTSSNPTLPSENPINPSSSITPIYTLSVDKKTVNEGDTSTVTLTTKNVVAGTEVPFKFSGKISGADIVGDSLPVSKFVIGTDGTAKFSVNFKNDAVAKEGSETLVVTLDANKTKTVTVTVKDMTVSSAVVVDGRTATVESNGGHKLIGSGLNDSLTGLAGADTLRGDAGHDYLDGGLGNDSLDGGNGNDTLIGGEGNDYLNSGSDNDSLDGGKGDDTLIGESGNDTLNGGLGVDNMTGGAGDDYYYVDNIKDTVIETDKTPTTGGNDTVESTSESYVLGVNIENLILKDVSGKGRNGQGNGSNNTIKGSLGDDKLEGMAGNDSLVGGDGADTLDGGLGTDTLVGGKGDDFYFMNNIDDFIMEDKNGGIDQIESTVDFNLGQSPNVEYLTLTGKKAVLGTGNALANLIQEKDGGNVNNNFVGNKGNDTLNGGGGTDTLEGGDGDDELNGGDGDDIAIFSGIYEDYEIKVNVDTANVPQLVVKYINSYNNPDILDGTDILNDVETLQFSDGSRYNKTQILQDNNYVTESSTSKLLIFTGVEEIGVVV